MDGLRVVLKRLDPVLYMPPKKCDFCGNSSNDELLYGKLHTLENLNVHYYCLLFACNLRQNGEDSEGILGFLLNDVRAEIRRSQKDKCSYCQKPGATVICVQRMCKKVFHLPCGMNNGSLHHFFKNFQSFCKAHRPEQKIPQHQLMTPEAPLCPICLEPVKRDQRSRTVIWAPCCKVAWMHRNCIQRLAFHAGYFFKCPRCNNTTTFLKAMRDCGIFVPEQDASWELEPNAFEELHHRHSECNAEKCICPSGRDHDVDDTDWEVILCVGCGSQGIHLGCLDPPVPSWCKWSCTVCTNILSKETEPAPSTSSETPSCSAAATAAVCTDDLPGTEERNLKRPASECVDRYMEEVASSQPRTDPLLPVQRGLQQQEQHTPKRRRETEEAAKEKENTEVVTGEQVVAEICRFRVGQGRGVRRQRGNRRRSGGRRGGQQAERDIDGKGRHIHTYLVLG